MRIRDSLDSCAELSIYDWNKFPKILTNWPKSHLMNYVGINLFLFSPINFVFVIRLTAEKYAKTICVIRVVREGMINV